ncbi:MAG: hypothetical protein JWQ38_3028 [Flavipsychrobacter sp.]|nr:hypothetical protein [Flavipsychrobacter sp.]
MIAGCFALEHVETPTGNFNDPSKEILTVEPVFSSVYPANDYFCFSKFNTYGCYS